MNHKIYFQLLCLVTYVVLTVYQIVNLIGLVPTRNLAIVSACAAIFTLFWLFRLSWKPMKADYSKAPGQWILLDRYTAYFLYLPSLGGTWLLLPYLDELTRLVFIIFMLATCMVVILGSLRHPPSQGFGAVSPMVLVTSSVLFVLAYQNVWQWAVAGIFVASVIALFAVRQVMQNLLNTTYYAQREAEQQRDSKGRFLASAWHDLGQPLQAARLSFDQLLSSDGVRHEKAARRVRWSFDTTEQLLSRMMEHLKLEDGAVEAKREVVALGSVIAQVAELNEPGAELHQVSIHAMPSSLKTYGDTQLVERVVRNLITNSLKHSKASRVLIGARKHGAQNRIWVIDDGNGIAAADQPRLFEDYVQGSDHGDEVRGGFGIGLASAKRMAELMGGKIGHEPEWKNGSAFWLELNGV